MYQIYPYPPGPARLNGDWRGRPLPPLPNKPFLTAILQYRPELNFEIFIRENPNDETFTKTKLTIIEPIDVEYGNFSQSVKACVVEGPSHLVDKVLFAKFYDPLYINPDDVATKYPEPHPTTPPGSSSSTDSARAETLDGSVELTRQKSAFSLCGDTLTGSVELKRWGAPHSGWDFEQVTGDSVDTGIVTGSWADKARISWIKDILAAMGDDHNPRNKEWDDTKFPVEWRKEFSDRCFTREERAYSALRSMQGRSVAKCFGSFHIKFPERELLSDRLVNGLLLEWLEGGKPLSDVDPTKFENCKRKQIRQTILDTAKLVYDKGIYPSDVNFGNFLLVGQIPRMYGFSFSFAQDELEPEYLERLPELNVGSLEYSLDEAGF